jgi:regulation of enolase protein 1 (concanavalin A-like superfamily)
MKTFRLTAIPSELEWRVQPEQWTLEGDRGVAITAGGLTDLFIDPETAAANDSAPVALFTPSAGNFILSANVEPAFGSTFDAGVLQVWVRGDVWAKLCFERSPQGEPTVVSVVTRGVSDDCNSAVVSGGSVFLRVSHLDRATAFHYSTDGRLWKLVRYFSLGSSAGMRAGFSSQSPTGRGCRTVFSQIDYKAERLADLRNGT